MACITSYAYRYHILAYYFVALFCPFWVAPGEMHFLWPLCFLASTGWWNALCCNLVRGSESLEKSMRLWSDNAKSIVTSFSGKNCVQLVTSFAPVASNQATLLFNARGGNPDWIAITCNYEAYRHLLTFSVVASLSSFSPHGSFVW